MNSEFSTILLQYKLPLFLIILIQGDTKFPSSPLTYFADGFVEGQDFFYSCREIRAGEGVRRDVMKAK